MAEVAFKVPSSSLSELEKIIEGYSTFTSSVSLNDISELVGINRTALSPNHPFLKEVGIIEGTAKKTATTLGMSLGRAIHHQQIDDVRNYL